MGLENPFIFGKQNHCWMLVDTRTNRPYSFYDFNSEGFILCCYWTRKTARKARHFFLEGHHLKVVKIKNIHEIDFTYARND